jgi:signal transduction histidine kinase
VWNERGASVALTLAPHFHQTLAFRALVLLAVALSGTGLFALRVRRLKARERELVALVDERTKDLHEAVRQKDEVVSIVAHDFQSPLTVIRGFGELLEQRLAEPELRKMASVITAQSRHLSALAADTLAMSRIDAGALPAEAQQVALADLVRSVVEAHRAESGAEIAFDAAEDGLLVRGDPERLHQLVTNLLDNAIKYSAKGAPIRVGLRRDRDCAEVSVADSGMGLAPEDLPKLFRRFSRLDAARKSRIAGTGLGLYICRSIVEAHGGRIWAESAPGRGSTFRVLLPLEKGPA